MDRRGALSTFAVAGLVACGGDSTGTDAGDAAPEAQAEADPCAGTAGVIVGLETDFPVGTWTLVQPDFSDNYIVGQDANGFFAFSAVCTHQGCIVQPPAKNGSTTCFCHGSQFDGNGNIVLNVVQGQASLQHFAINICNGNVYVDSSSPVSKGTRTPPQ